MKAEELKHKLLSSPDPPPGHMTSGFCWVTFAGEVTNRLKAGKSVVRNKERDRIGVSHDLMANKKRGLMTPC